nr:hypothetical protein GCM10020093_081230 [Planobispora longispora]
MDRADGLDERRGLDVLVEEPRRPGPHRRGHVTAVADRGQHQHARRQAPLGEPYQRAETVEDRHLQIEQEHVRGERLHQVHRLGPVTRLSHHVEVVLQVQEGAQPLSDDRMVVGDQHPDHTGTSIRTSVPRPGSDVTRRLPPSA